MRPKMAALACVAVLLAWLVPAQGQSIEEVAPKIDELRGAILEAQPIRADFDSVVEFGPPVVPLLRPMIEGEDPALRIAGGLLVARVAVTQGVDEGVLQALVQLANDSLPGVAYWGYYGLLRSPHVDADVAKEWTLRSLERRRPMAVRLLGCKAVADREVAAAAPWLVALIRNRKPDFERAKAMIFVEEVEIKPDPATMPAPTARRPVWEEFPEEAEDPDFDMRPERMAPKFEMRPIEVGTTRATVIRTQGRLLEQQGAVEEIRRAGIALEKVSGQNFRFSSVPPWDLQESISRALGWFEQNKGRYSQGPGLEEARPEPAEEAAPAPAPPPGLRPGRD